MTELEVAEDLFDYLVEIGIEQHLFIKDVENNPSISKIIYSMNYCGIELSPILDPVHGWSLAAYVELTESVKGFLGLNRNRGVFFKMNERFYRLEEFDHLKSSCK